MSLSLDDTVRLRARWRDQGRRVSFTNGCFDILHPGHVSLLEAARAEGDALIVGINSDVSVQEIKGPSRPVIPQHERAEVLLGLDAVDAVVVYDEPTPLELIVALRPDVLVKGADWALDQIVGRPEVESWGGRVVRVPLVAGRSTTKILERIRQP